MSSGLSPAEIAAELARLDAEDAQIQRRLNHLEVARELLPLTNAATNANPIPHYAEYQMQASHALNSMKRSELPMQMHASAPMQMHAAAPVIRLVQRNTLTQRALEGILLRELQAICNENGISSFGTKKELSDRLCQRFPLNFVYELIDAKLLARGKSGGKSHRRKSRHRRRKTSRAH